MRMSFSSRLKSQKGTQRWKIWICCIFCLVGIFYALLFFPVLKSIVGDKINAPITLSGESVQPEFNIVAIPTSHADNIKISYADRTSNPIERIMPPSTLRSTDIVHQVPQNTFPSKGPRKNSSPSSGTIPLSSHWTFESLGSSKAKSVLVVGGTDGSGTRRVVQILTLLGVTMVSEDPETYDIHADIVGGWPPVVSPVIAVTRSLDYNPLQLPANVYNSISNALKSLIGQHNYFYFNNTSIYFFRF